MNIEDVKQLDSAILNIMVTSAMRGEIINATIADIRRVNNYIACNYCYNIELAREAQAKAIVRKPRDYIENLTRIVTGDVVTHKINDETFIFNLHYLSLMLQATPRQICEAVYITLMKVQGQ